jgi:hypothetical protein
MTQLEPGDRVAYDNPHTGRNEEWTYTGPSWQADRLDLAMPGTSPQVTAQCVDPNRVRAL